MGAEGKFDLALAPSHDPEKLRKVSDSRSSALNKKSSSTPSLTETSQRLVAANQQSSVAGTEQAASADNITRQIKSVSDSLSNSVLLLAVYYSLCTTHCMIFSQAAESVAEKMMDLSQAAADVSLDSASVPSKPTMTSACELISTF